MFKVKARFIGKNSLGFINNNTYEFILVILPNITGELIEISTYCKEIKRCQYNSLELFINNWEIHHFEGDHEVAKSYYNKIYNVLIQSVRNYKITKGLGI